MINCPRCASPNLGSNRLAEQHLDRAAQFAQATQALGIRRLSVLAGLGALALKGLNALRKEFRCRDCEYVFDVD